MDGDEILIFRVTTFANISWLSCHNPSLLGHDEAGAPGRKQRRDGRREEEEGRGARDQEARQLGRQAQARRGADHVRKK